MSVIRQRSCKLRKLPCISYLEQKTNSWVQKKVSFLVNPQELHLATVEGWKFSWFKHVVHHDSLSKIIFEGTMEGGQLYGQQMKCWMDGIKEWMTLPMPDQLMLACCWKDWKKISAEFRVCTESWKCKSLDKIGRTFQGWKSLATKNFFCLTGS